MTKRKKKAGGAPVAGDVSAPVAEASSGEGGGPAQEYAPVGTVVLVSAESESVAPAAPEPAEPTRRRRAAKERGPLPPPRQWSETSTMELYTALARDAGAVTGRAALPEATPIPTPIRWFNIATDWGGLPGAKMTVLHGPSHEGKTALLMALLRAALDLGGLAAYLDNEEANFDPRFIEAMIGRELDQTPNMWFAPPKARSIFSESIRWIDNVMQASARLAAQNPSYPGCILGIDSLDNMMPDALIQDALRALEDAASVEDDDEDDDGELVTGTKKKGRGRGGGAKKKNDIDTALAGNIDMRKAAIVRPILGRMVAQAGRSKVHIVVVTHEIEEIQKFGKFEKRTYRPRGGKAVQFYGSLRVRVTKKERTLGDDAASEHPFEILKKRSGAVEPRGTGGRFFISTGRGPSPLGIDFAREALVLGAEIGVVESKAHHYYFEGTYLGQGTEQAVATLNEQPELMHRIFGKIDQWELSTRGQPRRVTEVPQEDDDEY